jgi:hypothetical protein
VERRGFDIRGSARATTPPNIATPRSPAAGITFTDLMGRFVAFGWKPMPTDALALSVVGTVPGQEAEWILQIRTTAHEVLETRRGRSDALVTFSRAQADIGHFVLFGTSSGEGIDTLAFNAPVVPEPGTLLLLGTGFAAAYARKRRR